MDSCKEYPEQNSNRQRELRQLDRDASPLASHVATNKNGFRHVRKRSTLPLSGIDFDRVMAWK
jgi:hypothetical protein